MKPKSRTTVTREKIMVREIERNGGVVVGVPASSDREDPKKLEPG